MRILIVEDDETLRGLYADILGTIHEVEAYGSAADAFSRYVNHSDTFDLAIVDFGLPLRNGKSLIFDMKSVNARQRIVMISGDAELPSFPKNFEVATFSKPVNRADLIQIVDLYGIATLSLAQLRSID